MNIEKLTCCLAKPMNAIRDLTAKVNEIITAHNDHLENHPSGGGGGGGGFIVNAVCGELDMEIMAADCTFDKSFNDTLAAIKEGQYVTCHSEIEGMCVFPVATYGDDVIVFNMYLGNVLQIVMLPDGRGSFIIQEE